MVEFSSFFREFHVFNVELKLNFPTVHNLVLPTQPPPIPVLFLKDSEELR